jgi:hypothetical protein
MSHLRRKAERQSASLLEANIKMADEKKGDQDDWRDNVEDKDADTQDDA